MQIHLPDYYVPYIKKKKLLVRIRSSFRDHSNKNDKIII